MIPFPRKSEAGAEQSKKAKNVINLIEFHFSLQEDEAERNEALIQNQI